MRARGSGNPWSAKGTGSPQMKKSIPLTSAPHRTRYANDPTNPTLIPWWMMSACIGAGVQCECAFVYVCECFCSCVYVCVSFCGFVFV